MRFVFSISPKKRGPEALGDLKRAAEVLISANFGCCFLYSFGLQRDGEGLVLNLQIALNVWV